MTGWDVEVNAGAWTRLRTEYRVRPTQGSELGVLMIEHVTIYVRLLLPPSRRDARGLIFSNHRASSALCPLSTPL